MDKNHEVFDDYVMKFDFGEDKIKYKYNHSYRVMNECKKIAESLDFDEEGDSYNYTFSMYDYEQTSPFHYCIIDVIL